MALSAETRSKLDSLVNGDAVVLFMKGNRAHPQCGFSGAVVGILDEYLETYRTVDVLAEADVREGIKEFSDWPTIPQLYVGGEFVGGADIVKQMNDSGELATLLGKQKGAVPDMASPLVEAAPVSAPVIRLTDAAIAAISDAREDADGPYLRLEVSADFQHGLSFDDKEPDDFVVEAQGVHFVVDKTSARRAPSIDVDFLDSEGTAGFKITNPKKNDDGAAPTKSIGRPEPVLATNAPKLTITEAAVSQFKSAIEDEEGEGPFGVRVVARRMGARRVAYELDVISASDRPKDAFELNVTGVVFFVDRMSARHLELATIDFIDSERGQGFKFSNPIVDDGWTDPRADKLETMFKDTVNPQIAAHGGQVSLLDVSGNAAYIEMGGGCQGCGMAGVTLQQGILEQVKAEIPTIEHLVDVTDHASGENPYYRGA